MRATVEEEAREDLVEEAVLEPLVQTEEGVEHRPRESTDARGAVLSLRSKSVSKQAIPELLSTVDDGLT